MCVERSGGLSVSLDGGAEEASFGRCLNWVGTDTRDALCFESIKSRHEAQYDLASFENRIEAKEMRKTRFESSTREAEMLGHLHPRRRMSVPSVRGETVRGRRATGSDHWSCAGASFTLAVELCCGFLELPESP